MRKAEQVEFVIYDDQSMRTAIRELIESVAKPLGRGRSFSRQNCRVF
jgi:hypothetical protein